MKPLILHFGGRCLLGVLLQASFVGGVRAEEGFAWDTSDPAQLRLLEGGKEVFAFQLQPRSLDGKYARANYVHPLFDREGVVVTEDFPKDHFHHRGIFWAWHRVLWQGKPVADPWVCRDIQWLPPQGDGSWVRTHATAGQAMMRVERDWAVPHPDREGETLRVVREVVTIQVPRTEGDVRMLDFDLQFLALLPGVSLAGSDDVKGYGGFSARVRLAPDVTFLGQVGAVEPASTAVKGGAWMDVVRSVEGKRRGVALLQALTNPDGPTPWILRSKTSMQNPQWPGRDPVPLRPNAPTRLQYRLILHDGDWPAERLEHHWRAYVGRNASHE